MTIDAQTSKQLCEINTRFYQTHYASFSDTRARPWVGWQSLLEPIAEFAQDKNALSVFDLACGNMRFEVFLSQAFKQLQLDFYAVDNCNELALEAQVADRLTNAKIHYQNLDIAQALLDTYDLGCDLNRAFNAPTCDIAVAFGFLHHIPTQALRIVALMSLLAQVKPGGLAAVTLWQFDKDDTSSQKMLATHQKGLDKLRLGKLEEGDYLLGWKDKPDVYRYCHSFLAREIDELICAAADLAQIATKFYADGKTGKDNCYLVFKVPGKTASVAALASAAPIAAIATPVSTAASGANTTTTQTLTQTQTPAQTHNGVKQL